MLRADITRIMGEYKAGERVPRYSQFDKLMSGSSLDGKALFKKPQNFELYSTSSLVAMNFVY